MPVLTASVTCAADASVRRSKMPRTPGARRTVIAVRSHGAWAPSKSGLPVAVRSETIVPLPSLKENTNPTVRTTGTASKSPSWVTRRIRGMCTCAPHRSGTASPSHCRSLTR